MNRITTSTFVGLFLLASGLHTLAQETPDEPAPTALTINHTSPVRLVMARPFTLDAPSVHHWRAERPEFHAGMALVLQVEDRSLIEPRQGFEPVLYVGSETAARLNVGYDSGYLVVLIPADLDAEGAVDLDLSKTPIFFGDPELPERVKAKDARAQQARALEEGVQAPSTAVVETAMQRQVRFADDWELHVWAANLIEAYSPQEVDLVSGLRAPRVGR
jgi:hypothetical protein